MWIIGSDIHSATTSEERDRLEVRNEAGLFVGKMLRWLVSMSSNEVDWMAIPYHTKRFALELEQNLIIPMEKKPSDVELRIMGQTLSIARANLDRAMGAPDLNLLQCMLADYRSTHAPSS